jgi:2-keto-4-pentenoate hydratase/2-oxohepta-3-ene-1,7-dioic acid hydratase in catechol pathway
MHRYVRLTLDSLVPIAASDADHRVLKGVIDGDSIRASDGNSYSLQRVRLLPPVSPSKIVCVGRNYAEHARELGNEMPLEPLIFLKPPSSLNAHNASVIYPDIAQRLDFEGELGVVIGRRARRIRAADFLRHIAGYTIVNDFTARDLQKRDGQWTRAKGFDTFCPVGPWMVLKEEIDFGALRIITRVNGEVRQDAPVSQMIFSLGVILEFVSQFMTLEPGDLISTGTPPGVGPVIPGDRVEVEIPGLGILANSIDRL